VQFTIITMMMMMMIIIIIIKYLGIEEGDSTDNSQEKDELVKAY
jgi:hypothetical protein